jgi:hypothetical protein
MSSNSAAPAKRRVRFLSAELGAAELRPSNRHARGCNRESKIYNLESFSGVLAQLVERLNGIESGADSLT